MNRRRSFPCLVPLLAVVFVLAGSGCTSTGGETPEQAEKRIAAERERTAHVVKKSIVGEQAQISIRELDKLAYGYADRYYMTISSAVDAIKRDNSNPTQRRIAHQIKLEGLLAMNDIVSGNDPYSQIFDLVVSVTLQSVVWIDENRAEKEFGDRAPGLIHAFRTVRVEAWELAAKVLTQEQLELLDYIILEWRRTHPQIDQVAFVKFDNFAGVRATGLLSDLKSGGGFLEPLSEASQVLRDWGRITERAFWYSKRAPNVAAIQAEGAVNEILTAPEIGATLATADRVGKTVEAVPAVLDEQVKRILADVDTRQVAVSGILKDVQQIVASADAFGQTTSKTVVEVRQTLLTLNESLRLADTLSQRMGLDQPSAHPFDIREYLAALTQLNETIKNLHQLSSSAESFTKSEDWKVAVQTLTELTDRRVDRIFIRLCGVLALAFVLGIAYRIIALKLAQRTALAKGGKS